MTGTTKVMLVDDHAIVRAGFRRLLDNAEQVEVIAEAGTGEEAYSLYLKERPDVVIMDLSMPPGAGGLEAIKRIRAADENARILVLTVQECEPFPTRVLQSGASGYLTKRCAPAELLEAVYTVARGEQFVAPHIKQQMRQGQEHKLDQLTARELQVFTHLANGLTTAEIAETMFISQKTVHAHRSNILNKLGLSKNADLIHLAIRHGVIDTTP